MNLKLWLMVAVFLPLFASPLLPVLGRKLGRRVGWVAFAFPVLSVMSILMLLAGTEAGTRVEVEWPWVPSLGVNFSFLVDGLSLLFGLIVSGVGVLIFFYANFYLDDHYRHHGRFYAYLTLFMAAMLGTVFSNHLILLFIFWELTGIASFLLIGFLHEEEASRVGARQALLVTALTGLVMLAGFILAGQAAGEYKLDALLGSGLPVSGNESVLSWAMVLILVGAFGKSAQVPFHFWLPNAMAAPTPVSAYLHSATMVKLGVFLTARVFPLFVVLEGWSEILIPIGFTTMALGAVLALLSHDLKAILAYSTVSALGSFIGYYGTGGLEGVKYDYLHILNHVFYKGCLFMVAGIVTHATGARDIRKLGGLGRKLPLLGIVCFLAAASMAGLPGTLGFVSKEALVKEAYEAAGMRGGWGYYVLGAVLVASTAKVAFSARFFWNIFRGEESEAVRKHFHNPGRLILIPPALLAMGAFVFGVMPGWLETAIHRLSAPGLNDHAVHLAVWHGLNKELLTSAVLIAAGVGIFLAGQGTAWRWAAIPGWLRVDRWFEAFLEWFNRFAESMTRWLRFDRPLDYLPIILGFTVVVTGGYLWHHYSPWGDQASFWETAPAPAAAPLRVFVAALMALAVLGVIFLRQWTTQLISLSVAGFLVTFYFVLYRAPDLALTQILVDTVTLILILILLGRFQRLGDPDELCARHGGKRNVLNAILAVGVGGTVTVFILIMTAVPHPEWIGQRFLDTTVELAKGSNAVNTILVDYRGFDTLFEITVLFIAMLGCLGLIMRRKRTAQEFRKGAVGAPGFGFLPRDKK